MPALGSKLTKQEARAEYERVWAEYSDLVNLLQNEPYAPLDVDSGQFAKPSPLPLRSSNSIVSDIDQHSQDILAHTRIGSTESTRFDHTKSPGGIACAPTAPRVSIC